MKELGHPPFIYTHPDYEPFENKSVPQHIIDEYIRNEAERTSSSINFPVVYDSIE